MIIFKFKKNQIITTFFIVLCLIGYVFFPADGYFQNKATALIFLIVIPFLYNKYLLKNENIFKKIMFGDWKVNLKWLAIGLLLSFLIMGIFFKVTDLGQHYLLSPLVKKDFIQFLLYELTGVAFTVAIYEFFFRGFVMFYFSLFFGKWAILLQFLFFVLMVEMFNLPYWFYIGYLVFAPFSGWIAKKSDSIVYSFVGQLFFIIMVDASFIALTVKK